MALPRRRLALVVLLALTAAGVVWHRRVGQAPFEAAPRESVSPDVESRPPAAPGTPRRVPFAPGETLSYDVSWSSLVNAGTLVARVVDLRGSQGALIYALEAEGRPSALISGLYPLHYRLETWLDAATLLPRRGVALSEEGERRRTRTTTFDHPRGSARYELRITTPVTRELRIPPDAQDALSAFYVARTLAFEPGRDERLAVVDGGRLHHVRLSVGARELVPGPRGVKLPAWRLTPALERDGATPTSRATLWISDDARRWPVRAELEAPFGRLVITLREATSPGS